MDLSKMCSVNDECADVYYENISALPERIREKVSLDMLHEIFAAMVVPAIQRARDRDKGN